MKGGTIRRIANTFRGLVGRPTKNKYADPELKEPRERRKKRSGGRIGRKGDVRPMIKRGHLGPPRCEIGTITYHDKLVRHFGARKARKLHRMAMSQPELAADLDFSAHPPWAFLNEDSGNGSGITSNA